VVEYPLLLVKDLELMGFNRHKNSVKEDLCVGSCRLARIINIPTVIAIIILGIVGMKSLLGFMVGILIINIIYILAIYTAGLLTRIFRKR
jgi:uncharacterized membrane protein